jgi:hypothetical protein
MLAIAQSLSSRLNAGSPQQGYQAIDVAREILAGQQALIEKYISS